MFVEKAKRCVDIEVENEADEMLKRLRPSGKRFKSLREFDEYYKRGDIQCSSSKTVFNLSFSDIFYLINWLNLM